MELEICELDDLHWSEKENIPVDIIYNINMNCNYDCDESPSLSSNDCLMKDVTVLICSGVDGLSIFVNFSRQFEYSLKVLVYKVSIIGISLAFKEQIRLVVL
jgi:hypothetical protein